MKKYYYLIPAATVFIVLVTVADLEALDPPAGMRVRIFTTEQVFRLNKDPIKIHMILANTGPNKIITRDGFQNSKFHRMLYFKYDNGRIITAKPRDFSVKTYSENGLPLQAHPEAELPIQMVLYFQDEDKQRPIILEKREELNGKGGEAGAWAVHTIINDAREFYDFPGTGKMTMGIKIPMMVYASTVAGTGMVELCVEDRDDCWQGALKLPLQSREAHRICLVDDADSDGYYYPCPYPHHARTDCDDADPSINPGVPEVADNGIDDDCNPETLDKIGEK